MDRERLLDEVLALPYAARFHRLRALGQDAISNPQVAALLDNWEQGDWQQRLCCVQSCTGNKDSERLHRLIDDPSRTIVGHALRLLAEYGSHEVLITVLAKLPHSRRRRLLVRLGARRRFDTVDAFLDKAFAESVPRIAELLPYGSAQAVNRYFGIADERGGVRFWERLARRHPRIAVNSVLDKVAATEQPDGLLLQYARRVAFYSGRLEPDLTVQLIKTLADFTPLSTLQVTPALYKRPNELARILLRTPAPQVSAIGAAGSRRTAQRSDHRRTTANACGRNLGCRRVRAGTAAAGC